MLSYSEFSLTGYTRKNRRLCGIDGYVVIYVIWLSLFLEQITKFFPQEGIVFPFLRLPLSVAAALLLLACYTVELG